MKTDGYIDRFHFWGLGLLSIGLASSKAIMSIAFVWLSLSTLILLFRKSSWSKLKMQPYIWLVGAIALLHFVALIWTHEFSEGVSTVKSRLPFLLFPLALGIGDFKLQQLQRLMHLAVLTLAVVTVINFVYALGIFNELPEDKREISLFGSHIRLALFIALAAGWCLHTLLMRVSHRWWVALGFLWFSFYTFYSEVLTGFMGWFVAMGILLLFFFWQISKWITLSSIVVLVAGFFLYFQQFLPLTPRDKRELTPQEYTASGNYYQHLTYEVNEVTNDYVYYNYSPIEMREGWMKRSKVPYSYDSLRSRGVLPTLARYMTSKQLPKNLEGIQQLTVEDIQNIEKGHPSEISAQGGMRARIYELKYQLINHKDPNGHSVLQRIEYWKTSAYLIKNRWLIGYGTGSNEHLFAQTYELLKSPLKPENRYRSHNQFMSFWISFGVLGPVLLIVFFFYLWYVSIQRNYVQLAVFSTVMFLSFLFEDTLETQLGVTLFAFILAMLMRLKTDRQILGE